jgi:hypothetical protein
MSYKTGSPRNYDICNRLKVDNFVEDIKLYQKNWLDHPKRTDRSRLPKRASSTNLRDGGILEDLDEDGETKNNLNFKT